MRKLRSDANARKEFSRFFSGAHPRSEPRHPEYRLRGDYLSGSMKRKLPGYVGPGLLTE